MGCCCSSSRIIDRERAPVYCYCPRSLEEHEPVSFTNATSSAVSSGLTFVINQDSLVPDAYRAAPASIPYDVGLAGSLTQPEKFGNSVMNTDHMQLTDSESMGEAATDFGDLKGSACKSKVVGEDNSLKLVEDEPLKLSESNVVAIEEEDVCPTCLEEYDLENPRIITKCEHHFHLSCILEWMERSDTCPICDQIMMFDMGSE